MAPSINSSSENGKGEEVMISVLTQADVDKLLKDEPEAPSEDIEDKLDKLRISSDENSSAKSDEKPVMKKSTQGKVVTKKAPAKTVKKVKTEPSIPPLIKVESSLREWYTIATMLLLHGKEFVCTVLRENECSVSNVMNKAQEILEERSKSKGPTDLKDKYRELCLKLEMLEEMNDCKDEEPEEKKPVPDYERLRAEMEEKSLKMTSFLQGKTVYQKEVILGEIKEEDTSGRVPVLPLVDHHAEKSLRKRIVIEQLEKA